jgi:hypothetical protein
MDAGKIRLVEHNTAVIANLANVITLALGQVMGKQVQRKLDGETITDEAMNSLVIARIKNKLAL